MKDGSTPKFLDALFVFYPILKATFIFFLLASWVHSFNHLYLGLALLFLFFGPPLLYRFFEVTFGRPNGKIIFGKFAKKGTVWFISLQLQQFYNSFPAFERFLMLVPGLYSFWLRLWGSKIGKKVIWTPRIQIVDRPYIEIGDKTLVGSKCFITSHFMKKVEKRYHLIVAPVKIGSNCVLSLDCIVAPGTTLGDRVFMQARAVTYPNDTIAEGTIHERLKEVLTDRFDFIYQEFERRSSSSSSS